MRKNTQAVIAAFKKGLKHTKYNSISTDGVKIFSYVTPIAWRTNNGIEFTDKKYSVTTSRQLSEIKCALG